MGIHSIIVIKNEQGKYLQYFDKRWNCYLFPNCKLPNGEDSNIVKNKVALDLNIKEENIKISLVGCKKHKKFSESDKIVKEYVHYFYKVKIKSKLPNNTFKLNEIEYKWFSYSELMSNERIKKVNSDIIQFVKEYNM